jgi:hypothetical protein
MFLLRSGKQDAPKGKTHAPPHKRPTCSSTFTYLCAGGYFSIIRKYAGVCAFLLVSHDSGSMARIKSDMRPPNTGALDCALVLPHWRMSVNHPRFDYNGNQLVTTVSLQTYCRRHAVRLSENQWTRCSYSATPNGQLGLCVNGDPVDSRPVFENQALIDCEYV